MFRTTGTTEATKDAVRSVAALTVNESSIEVEWAPNADAPSQWLTIDSAGGPIELADADDDIAIGQFPLPVGVVRQIRLHLVTVDVALEDESVVLLDRPPNLPSETRSGWKLNGPEGGVAIVEGDIIGARALFGFDRDLHHNRGVGYQLMPSLPYEAFDPNPPDGAPGVFIDQLTVLFAPGTTRAEVDAINAVIGASVAYEPVLGSGWRIKLPVDHDVRQAAEFYVDQPIVEAILPATNFAPHARPADANNANYDFAEVPAAWENGHTGSRRVRVAVIDGNGVDLDHSDLYLNIGINQGEIPAEIRSQLFDVVDPADNLLLIDDLNDRQNWKDGLAGLADCDKYRATHPVCDWNDSRYIDASDLVFIGSRFVNYDDDEDGVDDDGNGLIDDGAPIDDDGNGLANDLVGWDFTPGAARPYFPGSSEAHGTSVAGLVGALSSTSSTSESASGIAGIAFEVSIVPLKGRPLVPDPDDDDQLTPMPDVQFIDAIEYVERLNNDAREDNDIDVVVMSMGWTFLSAAIKAEQPCYSVNLGGGGPSGDRTTYSASEFGDRFDNALFALRSSSLVETVAGPNAPLYVFAAGNEHLDLTSSQVFHSPSELMQLLSPANVMLVGAAGAALQGGLVSDRFITAYSNYGTVVDIWAPGNGWSVLQPGVPNEENISIWADGTSVAAPVVAGAAALIVADHPELSAAEIRERLIDPTRADWDDPEMTCGDSDTVLVHYDIAHVSVYGATR